LAKLKSSWCPKRDANKFICVTKRRLCLSEWRRKIQTWLMALCARDNMLISDLESSSKKGAVISRRPFLSAPKLKCTCLYKLAPAELKEAHSLNNLEVFDAEIRGSRISIHKRTLNKINLSEILLENWLKINSKFILQSLNILISSEYN